MHSHCKNKTRSRLWKRQKELLQQPLLRNREQKGKTRDLCQKIQESKGKFKPRLGILNDQHGSTLFDQEKK